MDKNNNAREEEIRKQMIMMVVRQTSYDYETAEQKLIENGYNYDTVIKEYMGIKPKDEKVSNTKSPSLECFMIKSLNNSRFFCVG